MRHLGSLIAGLLLAPAAWLLLAVGQPRTETIFAGWLEQRKYDTSRIIGPLACLAAAGLLLGLIASLRLSPAGPAAAGVLYAAVYGVMLVNPLWGLDTIPERIDLRVFDAHPRTPVTSGTLAILALCLLTAVFSAKRWRRWPAATTAQPQPPEEQAPTDEPLAALPAGTSGGQFAGTLGDQLASTLGGQPAAPAPAQPTGPVPPLPTRVPTPAPREAAGQDRPRGESIVFPPPATEATPADETPTVAVPAKETDDQPPTSPWSGPPQARRG